MHRHFFFLAILSLIPESLLAQNTNETNYMYRLKITTSSIVIDGRADEQDWTHAQEAKNFILNAPVDTGSPKHETIVKMLCDDTNLYLLAICYDDQQYVTQTLKRDGFGNSDEFALLLDPVGKKANGFGFGVNAMNAQTEVLLSTNEPDISWDNRWYSAVVRSEDRWVVEMKIPLKSIRFNKNNASWRVNFARRDPGNNESSVWAPVPRQFDFADIGYFGMLQWPAAPDKKGGNISVIPYLSVRHDKTSAGSTEYVQAGGDAKVALTPALNLDLTTFSDFSQVEVDAQVTNLTRFNIFFPERRQFFIENNDIFSNFGQDADQVFYSRTIGLNNTGQPTPILYGARLTGNVSEKLRIGVFNMQTQDKNGTGANNFSAAAFQQRVFARSTFRGIFLNRQGWSEGSINKKDFGRNAGGDFVYTTNDGKFQSSVGYLHSFKGEAFNNNNGQMYGSLTYTGQNFRGFLNIQHVGKNYYSDMGFNGRIENFDPEEDRIVRIGYTNVSSMLNYYHYPKESKNVNYYWSGFENFVWVNQDGSGLNEWYTRLRHFFFFKNTSALRFRLNNNFVRLIFPFQITKPDLPKGEYNMTEFNIQYNSDNRKAWVFDIFAVTGQFYNAWKHTYRAGITYRAQPWGNFRAGVEHNDIRFPSPYEDRKITLGTIRAEINFSTSLFWTTFLQYNTQSDNFNINSRLQYRFAPMSDVFLVYTDNYGVENVFTNKSRFVVLKVNYWLTL
ncbi:MAG: carbohydrate binding family 9 domain-containing protein [Saprospiraceae bacterium]|nr:carbohydrate binding family 9 domain-containing protein [Saprospiraceae bacterium]